MTLRVWVCRTCRGLPVSGEVRMERNFALETGEAKETEAAYRPARRSHPATGRVELDFERQVG